MKFACSTFFLSTLIFLLLPLFLYPLPHLQGVQQYLWRSYGVFLMGTYLSVFLPNKIVVWVFVRRMIIKKRNFCLFGPPSPLIYIYFGLLHVLWRYEDHHDEIDSLFKFWQFKTILHTRMSLNHASVCVILQFVFKQESKCKK